MSYGRPILIAATLLALAPACVTSDATTSGADAPLTMAELPIMPKIAPTAGVFDQLLDHPIDLAAQKAETFKQRYWYTTEFATGPDSPVLFVLIGEQVAGPTFTRSLADRAKSLHAAVVVLEHRYYGESQPFAEKTLANMQYLTIHNALEDAATFDRFAKTNLPLSGKWIAVGGSYAGMLSAFYRLKHPELVVGAWATSAPVNVQLSFWGSDAIASDAYGPVCTALIQQTYAEASASFDDPQQRASVVTAVYGHDLPALTKPELLERLRAVVIAHVQGGLTRPVCSALQQHSARPLDGLLGYIRPPLVPDDGDADGGPAGPPAAAEDVDDAPLPVLGPVPVEDGVAAATPSPFDSPFGTWRYQTCTEVGFFQDKNPDRTRSVMPDTLTPDTRVADCVKLVGHGPDIEKTRATYYAPIMAGKASHIVFANGTRDPWSSLSITDPSSAPAGTSVVSVALGTHCEDLTNLNPTSILGVFEAHVAFHNAAKGWLAEP